MSACISRAGEYSDHEPGDWCPRCGAFNEESIISERDRLRAQIEEARTAWWSATEPGDDGLVYTDRIEDAMDDIWSAIGHAEWSPDQEDGITRPASREAEMRELHHFEVEMAISKALALDAAHADRNQMSDDVRAVLEAAIAPHDG